MKAIVLIMTSLLAYNHYTPMHLYDFSTGSALSDWIIVDDGVMGGLSRGQLSLTDDKHLLFSGTVSLDNNGGFSSTRCRLSVGDISAYTTCKIKLKGDGKNYQFRLKRKRNDWYSYVTTFKTSGKWETIEIPLSDLTPSFRGMQLDQENYQSSTIEEIAFLIGNKKEESFKLEIDWIKLD